MLIKKKVSDDLKRQIYDSDCIKFSDIKNKINQFY